MKTLIIRSVITSMLLLIGSLIALADPIALTANTTAVLSPGSSGAASSNSGATLTASAGASSSSITFTSVASQINVALNPGEQSNITLGNFVVTSNSALPLGSGPSFTGAGIQVTVSFTVPVGVNPQTFSGSLTGQIVQTASNTEIVWANPTSLTFSSANGTTIQLTLEPTTPINPPLAGAGNPPSEIRGKITLVQGPSEVPEPATLILLGTGLTGIAGAVRKSRNQKN